MLRLAFSAVEPPAQGGRPSCSGYRVHVHKERSSKGAAPAPADSLRLTSSDKHPVYVDVRAHTTSMSASMHMLKQQHDLKIPCKNMPLNIVDSSTASNMQICTSAKSLQADMVELSVWSF